jgi:hypothetical protein
MSSLLTLENSLILATVQTEPDVRRICELVERSPQWPVIVRSAERWCVVPSVYLQLKQCAQAGRVPGPVMEDLKHLYYRETIRGFAQRELLRAALLRFSEASVPIIVLKGAALATLVYQSHARRPTRRIELLVHRRDLHRVEAVLRSLREAHGAPMGGPQSYDLIDVRYHIFGQSRVEEMPAAVGIPIEDFWARARTVQIASVPTLVFGHEDLLLHLAMHLIATAFAGRVRTLCDIGETNRRYGEAIDWSQLIERARAYDLAKPLYYSLRLARELVGAGVPSQALLNLRASFDQLPLEDRFIAAGARRALLRDAQSTSSLAAVTALGVRLLLTRRARDRVRIVGRYLTRAYQGHLRRVDGTGFIRSFGINEYSHGETYSDLIKPLFSLPLKLPATAWSGHIPFLMTLIRLMRPKNYVELGVYMGSSLIAAATASQSFQVPMQLYGIDSWEGDIHTGHYEGDPIFSELKLYTNKMFRNVNLIRSYFDDANTRFAPGSIDILHIDGLHTYDAVKGDFTKWLPKMAADGVVLFHDTCVTDSGFGVSRFWGELEGRFTTINFKHSFGLGVILLDPTSDRLAPLVRIAKNTEASRFYISLASQLGSILQSRMHYLELLQNGRTSEQEAHKALANIREHTQRLESEKHDLVLRVSELSSRLSEREAELAFRRRSN